jgi:hypothetical protein
MLVVVLVLVVVWSKVLCSHIATFIDILGHLQMGKPKVRLTILMDRQRLSRVLDVRSFGVADRGTDHYLVVAKIRERLAVDKQRSLTFHMERFNLNKLNEL